MHTSVKSPTLPVLLGALAAAPLAWASQLLAQVRAELEAERAVAQLQALNDRELDDIGLTRDAITRAVRPRH